MIFQQYFRDFLHLFLPELCLACDVALISGEKNLCTSCLFHLPFTDFHLDKDNETAKQLWGKVDFRHAISMLYLAKSSRVEHLIHQMKYRGKSQIGYFLGELYGQKIKSCVWEWKVDCIVPVPLHISKERQRGYNQSAYFARGLAKSLAISYDENMLKRVVASASQTTFHRSERYDNVESVFQLNIPAELIADKHILLVDDILTTGATIGECAKQLIAAGAQVSIATIARA